MQPRRPQPHSAPPTRTTTWPISPAASRPVHGRPSSTMPPPTPVPQKTPSSDWNGRPAPSSNSASVATCTSLPSDTGAPHAFSSAPRPPPPPPPGPVFWARRRPPPPWGGGGKQTPGGGGGGPPPPGPPGPPAG